MTTSSPISSARPNLHGPDVAELLRRLAAGATLEELQRERPDLSASDLCACFAYAAEVVGKATPQPAKNETVAWVAAKAAAEPATLPPPIDDAAVTLPPPAGCPKRNPAAYGRGRTRSPWDSRCRRCRYG